VLPAAGTVVTEISTPMSAPDLAAVSDKMPAIPARNATMKENASGREMKLVSGCSVSSIAGSTTPATRASRVAITVTPIAAGNR